MNKIDNVIPLSKKEDKQNTRSDSVLWWMKKGKDAIYVQFLNNMNSHEIWNNAYVIANKV